MAGSSLVFKILVPAVERVGGLVATGGLIAVGEHVAKKSGAVDFIGGVVMDALGIKSTEAPALPPPTVGEAPASDVQRVTRYWCSGHEAAIVAGANDEIVGKQCDNCRAVALGTAERVEAMYDAWAKANDIDVGAGPHGCGLKPRKDEEKYHNAWGFRDREFFADLAKWQDCAAKSKTATEKLKSKFKSAEKKAGDKARSAQQRIAQFALAAQQKKYEEQIAKMQADQAKATSDAEKAALQKQIDAVTQQKNDAEKLQAQLAEKAKDDATAAKIDALSKEVADKAKQPGGMDQMFQQAMMMRMMAPQPPAAPPIIIPGMPAPPPAPLPWAAPPSDDGGGRRRHRDEERDEAPEQPVPQIVVVNADDGGADDIDFAGADDSPLSPQLAEDLGISGAATFGDARDLFAFAQNPDFASMDLSGVMKGDDEDPLACVAGCAIPAAYP